MQECTTNPVSKLFLVTDIPAPDFSSGNHHAGLDRLLHLMAQRGLKLYQSAKEGHLAGPGGLVARDDVVLIKVNAQWKYRGCTNSDVLRGLIQRILDHPEGFVGEVVMFDNGQGEGSMHGDAHGFGRYPDDSIQANAENRLHSFAYLAQTVFADQRVSTYCLDDIRERIIGDSDHDTDGFRIWENLSYPCFTTAEGTRVELREGVWDGHAFCAKIKLINVPVLKAHGGCGVTACLKSFYGLLSKGHPPRDMHYGELGQICAEMITRVRAPVLNVLDCIWVSAHNHYGYPESNNSRLNRLLAGVDPVAVDYWASKYIFYPISGDLKHHPEWAASCSDSNLDVYLPQASEAINSDGGVGGQPATCDESRMHLFAGRVE